MFLKSVLICDDHAMMRESVEGVIEECWPDAETRLVGDYPSAWAAMADGPSLCITDLMMPGAPPLDGVKRLAEASPATPILVFTGHEDDALLLALFQAGIAGFVPKTRNGDVVEAAIRVVLAERTLCASRLLSLAADATPAAEPASARLTQRQRDVLRLIAAGLSNKEVARELDLSACDGEGACGRRHFGFGREQPAGCRAGRTRARAGLTGVRAGRAARV